MKLIKRAVDKEIICFQLFDLAKEICQLMPILFLQSLLYIIKGVTLVYLNTVIRWTRLTRQTSKCVDSLYLYDNTHTYACT